MKIKLDVGEETYSALKERFTECGFEIDDEADLVLYEIGRYVRHLPVRDSRNDRVMIDVKDVYLIEAFGHNIEIHAGEGHYRSSDSLTRLESRLDPKSFLRISNSVIINVSKVKKILPTLSMKFVLTMENGTRVDVTRKYYYVFKDHFDI